MEVPDAVAIAVVAKIIVVTVAVSIKNNKKKSVCLYACPPARINSM